MALNYTYESMILNCFGEFSELYSVILSVIYHVNKYIAIVDKSGILYSLDMYIFKNSS